MPMPHAAGKGVYGRLLLNLFLIRYPRHQTTFNPFLIRYPRHQTTFNPLLIRYPRYAPQNIKYKGENGKH